MGISDWRTKRHIKYPERGIFRVTGFYDAHPGSTTGGTRITGVITAPGIPATSAEHKVDHGGRWAGAKELPVVVDRADPSRFVILWDEVDTVSWRDQEMQAAQAEADRINAGSPPPVQFGPGVNVTSTVVTIGPDGQPTTLSPETAAQVEAALSRVFGQADGQAFRSGHQPGDRPGLRRARLRPARTGLRPARTGLRPARTGLRPASAGLRPGGFGQPTFGPDGHVGAPYGGFHPAEAAHFIESGGGEQATATVLSTQDVPAAEGFAAPGGTVDVTLRITRADGSVYTTPTRLSFSTPERRAAVATPGTRLRVRIDPNHPARVAIDTTGPF